LHILATGGFGDEVETSHCKLTSHPFGDVVISPLSMRMMSARILPDEHLFCAIGEETFTTPISFSRDATIRCTKEVTINIVYRTGNITTMRWNEIHDLTIVFIAPNGQGWGTHRITFDLFNQLLNPIWVPRLGGLRTSRQENYNDNEYQDLNLHL
jgi:hypothetical protein